MGSITILPETVKDPISLMGRRAGICWGADISDPVKNYKRGISCIKSGHGRLFEFPDVHMYIKGYSARVMREYTRHIGGSTPWLQESTRYINYNDFNVVTPPSIKKNGEATVVWNSCLKHIREAMNILSELKIPREDIAGLLPLNMETGTVEKRNLRNLIDMSHVRECSRAYHEFRNDLFKDIKESLKAYSEEWAWIVDTQFMPKCELYGYCTEEHSCGRKPKKEIDNHTHKLFCIIGRTGSGKSTITKLVAEDMHLNVLKSYTTRNMRPTETEESADHIFISPDQVEQYREDMVAYTDRVGYCSFATKSQLLNSDLYVIDPSGYEELVQNTQDMSLELVPIYVYTPMQTIIQRVKERGDIDTWEQNFAKENDAFTTFEDSDLFEYIVVNDISIKKSIAIMKQVILGELGKNENMDQGN